ncbi:hypothetical protein [Paracerasibacillus soli]|uniref:Calcineurin-like phosphoesterase domain-containing protein n=1 Tax=Paracerasibacillus soli TaxID=480284 RepID=A0ABU5CNX9_9BACI|nr:hypothetical protein [Virgibacillus soli]MDY0408045.1 hypothetical protein [Virgibacillus soli]
MQKALQHTNPDLFTVLLAHEPDFANIAKNYPIDVQLSGHSHGGQVRFPIVGHLYTPAYAQQYIQGKYELNKENFILYVNKGIGTTRLPYRFLCKTRNSCLYISIRFLNSFPLLSLKRSKPIRCVTCACTGFDIRLE